MIAIVGRVHDVNTNEKPTFIVQVVKLWEKESRWLTRNICGVKNHRTIENRKKKKASARHGKGKGDASHFRERAREREAGR